MIAVEIVAAKTSPPPAASPMAATAQMLAAVVSPRTTFPRASAQEADARHHLRGHPRGVEHHMGHSQRLLECIGRHDHQQAGPDRHQHVGADARRPQQPLALEPDHAAQQRREPQPRCDLRIADHRSNPLGSDKITNSRWR